MNTKFIVISLLKFFTIILFTVAVTFVMARLCPPPKGTGFDGLDFVLKPVYMSLFTGLVYFVLSLVKNQFEKKLFPAALIVNFVYVVLLYLRVL